MIWRGNSLRARHRPFGAALGTEGGGGARHLVPGAVEQFRFFDLQVYAFADPDAAVAEIKAEAVINPTGRIYRQENVLFLRAAGVKIAFLREYFDHARTARALGTPILGLES